MYKHIFFDLDHTIWDFDKNAKETLLELYQAHELNQIGVSCPTTFIETYTRNNHELWTAYHLGKINKEELRQTRFRKTFIEMGLEPDAVPTAFEDDYVRICPTKTNLFPDAHEILGYLSSKYSVHLISNGFKESTEIKLELTGLASYFKTIVISEIVGVNKPNRAIFKFALDGAGAAKHESLMIGDSLEADVRGAMAFGIDAIFFNPVGKAKPDDIKWEIKSLWELKNWL